MKKAHSVLWLRLVSTFLICSAHAALPFDARISRISHVTFFGAERFADVAAGEDAFGDDYIVAAQGQHGLLFLANRSKDVIGRWDTPGTALGLAAVDGTLFVADGEAGLQIIDAADPNRPVFIGHLDTAEPANAITANGHLALVAAGSTFLIIDVTDPVAPLLKSSHMMNASAETIYISANLAFVAQGNAGVEIIDVTDVAAPARLALWDSPGEAHCVAVVDGIAYVADGAAGVHSLDISDPANPKLLQTYTGQSDAHRVIVSPFSTIFVCGGFPTLEELAPEPGGKLRQIHSTGGVLADRMVHASGNVFLVLGNMLYAADLSAPFFGAFTAVSAGSAAQDVVLSNGFAHVADALGGLRVVDVTTPSAPLEVARYESKGVLFGLVISGNIAALAEGSEGLRLVDIADPTDPKSIGRFDTPGQARDIAVIGKVAYLADAAGGLQIVDFSNPEAPKLLSSRPAGTAMRVAAEGNLAAVLGIDGEVRLFDVRDPTNPVDLPTITVGDFSPSRDVALAGHYLYVASSDRGLYIFDVTNPQRPVLIEPVVGFAGRTRRVFVSGARAFISDGSLVHALDVSNPAVLKEIGSGVARVPQGVAADGDLLYLADEEDGLSIFTIKNLPRITWVEPVIGLDTIFNSGETVTFKWSAEFPPDFVGEPVWRFSEGPNRLDVPITYEGDNVWMGIWTIGATNRSRTRTIILSEQNSTASSGRFMKIEWSRELTAVLSDLFVKLNWSTLRSDVALFGADSLGGPWTRVSGPTMSPGDFTYQTPPSPSAARARFFRLQVVAP
jgi:hypothetical protein